MGVWKMILDGMPKRKWNKAKNKIYFERNAKGKLIKFWLNLDAIGWKISKTECYVIISIFPCDSNF